MDHSFYKIIKQQKTIFNTGSNRTINNWASNLHIRVISQGSCDTKTEVKMLKNQLCITWINYIWKYIQIDTIYFKL